MAWSDHVDLLADRLKYLFLIVLLYVLYLGRLSLRVSMTQRALCACVDGPISFKCMVYPGGMLVISSGGGLEFGQ